MKELRKTIEKYEKYHNNDWKGNKMIKNKKNCRNKTINYLAACVSNEEQQKLIKTKFMNISAKTGQYNVPNELFQKRTPRDNRVLMSWETVKKNGLTFEQLDSFENGITIEFINNDYFIEENNELKNILKTKLGSDENVSSIISIRSQEGTSSSSIQREAFEKLCNGGIQYQYRDERIKLTENNLKDYYIRKKENLSLETSSGKGNEKWEGFIYISIKGGQQDTINSHDGNITLFNPACEYASEDVKLDLDLTLLYFALHSVDLKKLEKEKLVKYIELKKEIEEILRESEYQNKDYTGNLLDYCYNHSSLRFGDNQRLVDPIQIENIDIIDFSETDKSDIKNIDLTHNEAVRWDNYYWDEKKQCVLTPARPTNVFWSRHLSNMLQQDFMLEEFFEMEKERVKKREQINKKLAK